LEKDKLLYGKVIVIIGASRGIGLEISKLVASQGCSLAVTDIPERYNMLESEAIKIEAEYGVKVNAYPLDIKVIMDIKNTFKEIERDFSYIDILVNNAGINILVSALETNEEMWDEILNINLKGAFFSMQQAARIMIKNNGGSIVNIASQHGIVGNKNRAPYCSSKAGLINLTRALAYEWAMYDIRVNSVSPTFVLNDLNEKFLFEPKQKKEYLNKIPLRKYCLPQDIAHSVLYLVSPHSSMVTGHNLVIDGGWTAV
jgi:2-deoxy-D-gluconate 3-dehydrogenase